MKIHPSSAGRLLLAASALGLCQGSSCAPHNNGTIAWKPCGISNSTSLCGSILVPLDYSDPKSTKLELKLLKVPAPIKPSKGSILFNPGGPGAPGQGFVESIGPLSELLTGGQFDMIGFDPRGTGTTIPFQCLNASSPNSGLISSLKLLNSSDTAIGDAWALSELFAKLCYDKAKDIGSFIGTASVVKDMVNIIDALGEDGQLRFWGFSYGTLLGATFASMYPERVDKMILDGVVNPHNWYHGYDNDKFHDMDATWDGFVTACLANPTGCKLAQYGKTPEEITNAVQSLLTSLKYRPRLVEDRILTYTIVKTSITLAFYTPSTWHNLSDGLAAVLSHNTKATIEFMDSYDRNNQMDLAQPSVAIMCSDRDLRTDNLTDLQPMINYLANVSWFAGDGAPIPNFACAHWKMAAKELYKGDFKVETRNPVLLLGNTHDPLTPLIAAHNVSAGFKGSVVLEQNTYGHASLAEISSCTFNAVKAYLNNGTMPAKNAPVCQPDSKASPFSTQQKRSVNHRRADSASHADLRKYIRLF